LKVAVVGGGIAGIAAAHKLSEKHDVTLFEASETLGGHAHSETIRVENRLLTVDTAFLIFNMRTYPLFCAFLEELGVAEKIMPAEMSSCFYSDDLCYSLGLPQQPLKASLGHFFRLDFLSIFIDLLRFRRRAASDYKNLSDRSALWECSVSDYLSRYGEPFCRNFAYPLMAAIWSLPVADVENHPVASILNYFGNHSLLEGKSDRKWNTFVGSSQIYLDAFTKSFRGKIRLANTVKRIIRTAEHCQLIGEMDDVALYDRVVIATHADTALALLDSPTDAEKNALSVWKYRCQPVTLHRDASVLHRNRKYWASWNMLRINNEYRISYYLNRLQNLPVETPVILSLGEQGINQGLIYSSFRYHHPVFDQRSVASQRLLNGLNNGKTAFCGSYFGHGFHEDAFKSGVEAAASIVR
jgi:predicted NAD/FAD-binding protein